ncbi:MAG TPA: HAD hydrolase-like protein [Candidatus Saccharimonadales bacterium]|nr:HAD hydrolase-like protein [Candidatus Saccharimonadales bacterium]
MRRINKPHGVQKQAVIFDFDGTIADSLPALVEVFEDLTGRTDHYTAEQIDAFRALTIPELMKELHVSMWRVPQLLLKGRKMLKAHMHGIAVHEGMTELVEELHAKEVPLYVLSSNSTENVQMYLGWHKLSHCFAAVYGGASLFTKARRILQLVDNEQIDIANSWYVGDETRDVIAARAVGLHIASVTWGLNARTALEQKEPDILADTPQDLLAALEHTWKK